MFRKKHLMTLIKHNQRMSGRLLSIVSTGPGEGMEAEHNIGL